MLGGRPDIRASLEEQRAAIAIIPQASYVTALPEFAYLSGGIDRNGNTYDSFSIRGLGAVQGQPVTATSEENLLQLPDDPFWCESVTHHEFAHAIMNLGFTPDDRARWSELYQEAEALDFFPGTSARADQDEYFAELTQSYFDVNCDVGGPGAVETQHAGAFDFLRFLYGP